MNWDLLKQLCETPAVPGREEQMRSLVRQYLAPLVDSVETDVMGNMIGRRKREGKPRVMVAAHMDEIGFMVKFIDEKGFLRLQPLGGFDPRQLFAQRVIVHSARGQLRLTGVLSYTTKPTHMLTPEEAKESPVIDKFFVDLGLPVKEVKAKVSIGDMVTMDREAIFTGNVVVSKAIDNRVGLYVMLEAVARVVSDAIDLYAVATVQEEVGLRGATTSAYAIHPDIGIALDTTLANDYPGITDVDSVTRLGEGVAIKLMDASLICHADLVEHMREIALEKNIPHQLEILPRGGTDGGALQRTRGGTASITLSIPTRYIHTVNEMANKHDIEAAVTLLAAFLNSTGSRTYIPGG